MRGARCGDAHWPQKGPQLLNLYLVYLFSVLNVPFSGNLDVWISRVNVVKLVPKVEYYDESQSTDSDEDA